MSGLLAGLVVLAVVTAACCVPAAYAEVQFHILTQQGNTFIISPPDLPRPANIIGESAHLVVENPPAGMFVVTAPNGTTHKFTPLQAGLDVSGFAGGTIRVIYDDAWGTASDRTFRDQPFGRMINSPMYHQQAMPLATGWSASYHNVTLVDDSVFGRNQVVNGVNTLGLPRGTNGEYKVSMGSYDRVGLDFGAGTGYNWQVYYIYRGCINCKTEVVVGHGSPAHDRSALPNNVPAVTDHDRGWKSTGSCAASGSTTWSTSGSRSVTGNYHLPAPAHSQADDYGINNRYANLSVLPGSHSSCGGGTLHSDDTADNRKHDMCVAPLTTGDTEVTTTYSYPYTKTTTSETYLNGVLVSTSTTTTSGSTPRTTYNSCSTPYTTQTSDGYRVRADSCSHGPTPANPPQDRTTRSGVGDNINGTISEHVYVYGSPSRSSTATVESSCSLTTNTPHLNLDDAMTIQPGLNVYQPTSIPANHNILMILDDTTNEAGSNEYIQIFRYNGINPDSVGPYDFHLRPSVSGILYDPHRHYGWVDTITYNAEQLADMGYTPHVVMAGSNDGLRSDGNSPYRSGQRLCHGDCFMGPEGIDTTKPAIREVTPKTTHAVPSVLQGLIYDHVNDRWFDSSFTGTDNQVAVSSLYLLVPFAEDVSIVHVHMYGNGFDPNNQNPSTREVPGTRYPCHISQAGGIYTFSNSLTVSEGDRLMVPILPEMRYVAFIGNSDCYWYDVASLPSPLAGVSAGARTVPLVNGTVLTGDLAVSRGGSAHVDVVVDLAAIWQSELYGHTKPGTTGNTTWVESTMEAEVVVVARVNGARGACGSHGVYCSHPIMLTGGVVEPGTYIHTSWPQHGEPYVEAPASLPANSGVGVYGMINGKCYGLANMEAWTGGVTARDIPNIRVRAGDTITLSFNATIVEPATILGDVTITEPTAHVCTGAEITRSAILDIRTMTATLR